MGFMDKAKGALGMGGEDKSEADEMAEDWIDDVDSEVEQSDEEMEPESVEPEEPEVREWDSAYKFAEDYLEVRGFASMTDFANKCMAYKIDQSPMYRDRVANGVDTMNRISSMKEQLASVQGGNEQGKGMAQKAEELKQANEVIDQAQKLSGQEDAMVRDMIGLGEDLVNTMAERSKRSTNNSNVDSNVNKRNEEM